MDTFGPISDNAQGIAEMSGEFEGRPAEILGGLDAIGNSTKAITKGMAIATAVDRGDVAVRLVRGGAARRRVHTFDGIRVDQPDVLVGLLLGGSRRVPVLARSRSARSAARRAQVVVEVRNQFRDHPGIMDYTEKPDYGRGRGHLHARRRSAELTTPGLLAVLAPVIAGFLLKARGARRVPGRRRSSTGQLLAVMLSNSGGAWDNAKKFIEEGTSAARAARRTRPRSSATRSATRSRTPPARR